MFLKKLNEVGIENCAISEITLAKLVFGAEKSNNPKKNHKLIEKFVSQLKYCRFLMQFQSMEKKKQDFKMKEN